MGLLPPTLSEVPTCKAMPSLASLSPVTLLSMPFPGRALAPATAEPLGSQAGSRGAGLLRVCQAPGLRSALVPSVGADWIPRAGLLTAPSTATGTGP